MIGRTQNTLRDHSLCKEGTQSKRYHSVITQRSLRAYSLSLRRSLKVHSESVPSRLEINAKLTRNALRKKHKEHTKMTRRSLVKYSEQLRELTEITQRSSIEQSGHKTMNSRHGAHPCSQTCYSYY